MPSAAADPDLKARFAADHKALLDLAGLPAEAAVGIALSGGPDSLALLILASALPGVAAMTVDHGLRPDSAAEAEVAGTVARALGVPHAVARVDVARGGEGVQGEARRARYAALGAWAQAGGLAAILTAHHADDQAETLLMRLSRGAGITGLTGIRRFRPLDEARAGGPLLLRPLLGWRKADLAAIVAASGLRAFSDPSNRSPRFDRTTARNLLAETPWLDPGRLAASADHLRDADRALDWMTDRLAASAVSARDGQVDFTPGDAPDEIVRRTLKRLFSAHFGASPRGPQLASLMAVLAAGGTATLADVLATGGPTWRFRPAPPRRSA